MMQDNFPREPKAFNKEDMPSYEASIEVLQNLKKKSAYGLPERYVKQDVIIGKIGSAGRGKRLWAPNCLVETGIVERKGDKNCPKKLYIKDFDTAVQILGL